MNTPNDSSDSRQVTQIRVRALLFLVIAVAAGGGAMVLVKQYMDRVRGAAGANAPQAMPVVVAAMDVPIAVRLEAQHVKLVQWPKSDVPEGAYHSIKEVLDRTVQTNIMKGEPILLSRLADDQQGRGLAALLAPGIRAMAVQVDSVIGVAGFVQPGDFVDVITTMQPDEETQAALSTKAANFSKIILQNIMVLAVGEHLSTEGSQAIKVQVVTLGVTPDQTERLALASQYGHITLTMRPRIDQAQEPTQGITPLRLLTPDDPEAMAQQQPVAVLRQSRPHRRIEPVVAPQPAKPEAPVVEILRGTKIEERKLRISEQP